KRFDIVRSSAQQASDALAVSGADEAAALLRAPDFAAARAIVGTWRSAEGWFGDWRTLFVRAPETSADDDDLSALADQDSVTGWTLANVLRRVRLSEHQQARLREMFDSAAASTVLRWRIVHVLGWHPGERNALFLLKALREHELFELQLGTLRAIIEVAA